MGHAGRTTNSRWLGIRRRVRHLALCRRCAGAADLRRGETDSGTESDCADVVGLKKKAGLSVMKVSVSGFAARRGPDDIKKSYILIWTLSIGECFESRATGL